MTDETIKTLLLFAALVMGWRQVVMTGNIWALVSRHGRVAVSWQWHVHLFVTAGIITAAVVW